MYVDVNLKQWILFNSSYYILPSPSNALVSLLLKNLIREDTLKIKDTSLLGRAIGTPPPSYNNRKKRLKKKEKGWEHVSFHVGESESDLSVSTVRSTVVWIAQYLPKNKNFFESSLVHYKNIRLCV